MLLPPKSWRAALAIVIACLCAGAIAEQTPPVAGSSSSRSKSRPAAKPEPDAGTVADGVYRNRFFGYSCKIPFGWVDRTDRMQGDSEPGKSQVLLAVFEHPPEASAETINSAIVFATETADTYPGLKSAAEYFGPLSELTASKGFKSIREPYETIVGTKKLVRADFKREMGSLTMYQSSLAIMTKGFIASFTFIAESEDEVEQLVSGVTFNQSAAEPRKKP